MNRMFLGLFILFTMLLPCLAFGAGSPVLVTHKLTSYTKGADTVTLDYSVKVTNRGETPLSDVVLVFIPRAPFITKRTTLTIGSLDAHQSLDLPLQLVTRMMLEKERFLQTPLSWAGTCRDAEGKLLEFPVRSKAGGAR